MSLKMTSDGALVAHTGALLHTSTDGGRTWESRRMAHMWGSYCVATREGALVRVDSPEGEGDTRPPATVWESTDMGSSFQKIAEIDVNLEGTPHPRPIVI